MTFKKSIFFLSLCFIASGYSAESPLDETFTIECTNDPAFLGQVVEEMGHEKKVLVVLHWSYCDGHNYIPSLVQKRTESEIVLNVYFWERIPHSFEKNIRQQIFLTKDLKAFFYPLTFMITIFPRITIFDSKNGVTVADEDYSNYATFPHLINQVLISILREKFIYKKIVYLGNSRLLQYIDEVSIHQALDEVYKEEASPLQKFTAAVTGTPPRPAAVRQPLLPVPQVIENRASDFRAGLSGLRSRLMRLQEAPSGNFPVAVNLLEN